MKDILFASIAVFVIMFYVEVRIRNFETDGSKYTRVALMKLDNNGDTLYFPVYRRLTR